MSRALVADAEKDLDADVIIFDGIRKVAELEFLKTLSHFRFIYIDAVMKTRYDRLIKRGEKVDDIGKTMEQFMKDHEHAADNVIPKLREYADVVLDNNGTLEDLYSQINKAMTDLKK